MTPTMTTMCRPIPSSMLIAQTSKIEVVNATGKESYLPVAFYRRMMAAGSTYTDPGTGEAIQIVDAGEVEMISVTTKVVAAPIPLMTMLLCQRGPRSRRQCTTMPACDSVNDVNTPMA